MEPPSLTYDVTTRRFGGDFNAFFKGRGMPEIYAGYGAFLRFVVGWDMYNADTVNLAEDDLAEAGLEIEATKTLLKLRWKPKEPAWVSLGEFPADPLQALRALSHRQDIWCPGVHFAGERGWCADCRVPAWNKMHQCAGSWIKAFGDSPEVAIRLLWERLEREFAKHAKALE